MARPARLILRRSLRRLLLALGAGALLWFGLGEPHRARPQYQASWIEADGMRTRALRAGRGDTTLVFLHGYAESLLSWRLILDRFTRRYHVLAIDLPGFGLADKPPTGYDYPRYQRWLAALLTRYTSGPLVVIGHSMGGQLAAGFALEHPDRVIAAVLLDPAGAGLNPGITDSAGFASENTLWLTPAMPYLLPVHDSAWMGETPAMLNYEPARDSGSGTAARRVLEQFNFNALKGRFSEIRQPVLLIWGEYDHTIPIEVGRQIAAALPCRQFVPLSTMHRPHQTVPDTVAVVMLRFLEHPACI